MAYSMTGYAQAEGSADNLQLTVTIRSVNHRFLDLKLRTPPEADSLEPEIRRRVKAKVRRGSVQINVNLESAAAPSVSVDQALVTAYLDAYRAIAEENSISADPDLNAILRLPGAVSIERAECGEGALKTLLFATLDNALDRLNEARLVEGRTVVADLEARAIAIGDEVDRLRDQMDGVNRLYLQRLETRLGALLADSKIEDQRLLHEAAVMAERTDISEELQRLGAHVVKLKVTLAETSEIGKQLDFLAQEMNREANTMLSKTNPLGSDALPVTEAGLRLKAEIEKIREQVQNVE
jgi:uncharacterized protein (TIGR00255 family)